MSSYTCLRTRSRAMKCGLSHATTCTCHSELDAPWGRILMLTPTLNKFSNWTQKQLSCRRD